MKAIIKNISYETTDGKSIIKLETDKGIFCDKEFKPYFYIKTDKPEKLQKSYNLRMEKDGEYYKVVFENTNQLTEARELIGRDAEKYEHDIPFVKRYMTDKGLSVPCVAEIEEKEGEIKEIKFKEIGNPKIIAVDIETYTEKGGFEAKNSEIIMVSFSGEKNELLTTFKGLKNSIYFQTEKEMIKEAIKKIEECKEEIVATYNGDMFDFPFIEERAKILGLTAPRFSKKKGQSQTIGIEGKQHIDGFQMLKFLTRFSIVSLMKYDLESVVENLLGRKKEKIDYKEIHRAWREKDKKALERIVDYCIEDSETTRLLVEKYLGIILEISDLVRRDVQEISRASASVLIEALLLKESKKYGILVPRLPTDEEFSKRFRQSVQGGYVKSPLAGLHENIAVLDFSSLYPTIIISHNVSNETLDCEHLECKKNTAPTKHYFCMKKKGFIPSVIEDLLKKRLEYKKQMNEKKGTKEYKQLSEKSWGYKIFLNSFYGYLGYARSRFYCRECAAAITSWAREYIQMVGEKAEKDGYTVLYGDTDSEFLIIPKGKNKKDIEEFVEKINKNLPGIMNLELEGIYKRGLFVTKDSGETAKKRYALIDEKGNMKIAGLEYVRRDWSKIARETQRKVLQAILEKGSEKEALQIIRDTIERLKKGKVEKKELTIITRLIKDTTKYEARGPHVAAAEKAKKRGKILGQGSVIEYIITKTGKTISDKAEIEEYVKEGDYDIDYYIEHQIISVVYKIMREFGYSKTDLEKGGQQKSLFNF